MPRFPTMLHASTWQTVPCDEREGYSQWHLLALGILGDDHARYFLESTLPVPGGILLDDLMEHMTGEISPVTLFAHGWPLYYALPQYRGLSVEQICRREGCTLLSHYWCCGACKWKMHPLVASYESWIAAQVARDWGYFADKRG